MKLQGLSVFFCLIAVPIILVLTAYVQAQINTISMQLAYDTKLLDATHDAMVALEINTANENLSSVSDSLRSIVNASANTFINSLSTNMGMSSATKSALQPYIPAIVVTLYDGYYIYSPTRTPVICKDENGVAVYVGDKGVSSLGTSPEGFKTYQYNPDDTAATVGMDAGEDYGMLMYKVDEQDYYITQIVNDVTEFTTDYVLKAYIPYAARYKSGDTDPTDFDVQINYTLDNFVNIYGEINGVYYTKSGYYSNVEIVECSVPTLLSYSETSIDEYLDNNIDAPLNIKIKVEGEEFVIISSGNDEEKNAIRYYLKSYIFSKWVNENLAPVKISNIQERISEENKDAYGESIIGGNDNHKIDNVAIVSFEGNDSQIFNSIENPEEVNSTFSLHKSDVMKNSIQYNLNLAMSSYNEMNLNTFSFNMPVLDEDTWNDMTSKVSIVAFMQGFKCGLKTYNNYACVSSTNNEFTVIPEEIYYVGPADETALTGISGLNDENTKYHRIDCPDFTTMLSTICSEPNLNSGDAILEKNISSMVSKEIKYDKVYNKLEEVYQYDHKNSACYQCIISRNYKTTRNIDGVDLEGYYNSLDYSALSKQAKKVYLIALAKEREELYKTNEIALTQGVETDLIETSFENTSILLDSELDKFNKALKDIKSIDITLSEIEKEGASIADVLYVDAIVNGSYRINNPKDADGMFRLIINQSSPQTITLLFENSDNVAILEDTNILDKVLLDIYITNNTDPANKLTENIKYKIESVKVNYK